MSDLTKLAFLEGRNPALIIPIYRDEWQDTNAERVRLFALEGDHSDANQILDHINPKARHGDENGPLVTGDRLFYEVPDNRLFPIFRKGDVITFATLAEELNPVCGSVVLGWDLNTGELCPGIVLRGYDGPVVYYAYDGDPADFCGDGVYIAAAVDFESARGAA